MKHPVLASFATTLLASAISLCLYPAHAADPGGQTTTTQQTDAATGAAQPDNTQAAPAQSTSTSPQADQTNPQNAKRTGEEQQPATLSTITVTGIRGSLQSAESMKRDARMVTDSVAAEDIGKLPDNSVADAMQRIPGVQVAPDFQSETASVVVRGLPNVITTLNGRNIFSGVGRSFAFQNLPATAVKSLTVYKSSDASLPDGGIAGVVNIDLFRPFDFKSSKIAGTLTETNSKYGAHTDPTASLLLSNNWQTGIGKVGALVNFGYMQQHYDYNAVWGDFPKLLTDGSGTPILSNGNLIAAPNGWGADYNIGYRKRGEFNYALQWAPNENTEFYVEGLYDWDHDDYDQPFFFSFPVGAVTPTNLSVSNTCYANQLTESPYYGQTICDANGGTWTGNTYAATSTQAHQLWGHDIQNSIGAKWRGQRLNLSTDLTLNTTSFEDNTFIVDTFLKAPITTVWTGTGGNHQNWSLGGAPATDPANFYLNGLFQDWTNQRAKQLAWRADGTYDLNGDFFRYLDFGVRYADHKAQYHGSVDISTPPPGGTGDIALNPNPANQVIARYPDGYFCSMPKTSALPTNWLTGCYNFLVDNADAIRELYGLNPGLAPENPGRFYDIDERSYAGYAQVGYGGELFGIPFDGLAGVRVERIKRNLNAFSFNASTGVYTPISNSTNAPVYLPNISFNWHLRDDLLLRLDAAKTVTYPDFGALNPSISLNPGTINRAGIAASGNANLSPIRSTNFDASVEWYFGPASYASAAFFYRKINGYIQSYVTNVTIGGQAYQLSSPQSAGKGFLDGVELQYQQFFDFLPGALAGLGLQVNYTYINGDTRSPQYIGGPTVISPLQNVSKNNGNVVLIYERNGWSARLAYDYRSRFIDGFNQPTVAGVYDEVVLPNQVDFSLAYDVDKRFTVVLNATNLFGAVLHQYWGDGTSRPRDIRYTDRTVGLGLRFKM